LKNNLCPIWASLPEQGMVKLLFVPESSAGWMVDVGK